MAAAEVAELAAAAREALAAGQVDEAFKGYACASQSARELLPAADPLRIALAEEHGQAWFEHREDPAEALRIATLAYDEAVEDIDEAGQHQAAVARLGRLRDQMTFWAFRLGQ